MVRLLLALVLLLLPCSARADDAGQLLERASELYKKGEDHEQAATLFRRSYELEPNWRALNGQALALTALGHHVEALTAYQRLLKKHERELGEKRADRVRSRIREASARVGHLQLEVAQPDVKVTIDGELVLEGSASKELVLDPGAHAVEARATGFEPYLATLRLEPGERQRLSITLAREQPVAMQPKPPRKDQPPETSIKQPHAQPQRDPSTSWVPWTLAGSSAVLVGVGAVLQLQASSDFDDFDRSVERAAQSTELTTSGNRSLETRAERKQTAAIISYAVGGAALGAAVLWWVWPSESGNETQLGLTPQGIVARGRF